MSGFKPLLSATLEVSQIERLPYPVLVSPKLDGIRCIVHDGMAVSRNLKPIRNQHIRAALQHMPNGLDGELIVGPPNVGHVLNRTSSGVMSAGGEPDFTYWVFDNYKADGVFISRFSTLSDHVGGRAHAKVVPHDWVVSPEELLIYEQRYLDNGYEGLMVRGQYGRYKFGRARHSDNILWKFKRFRDGEARVMYLREGQENCNPPERDELGRIKRSTLAMNMWPNGQVGTLVGVDLETGEELEIAAGRMSHYDRAYYWKNQEKLIGKIVKFKTFDYGAVDAPRFSTFQAFRDESDMST